MENQNITMEIIENPVTYKRGKYVKKDKQPLTEEQLLEKKEKAKQYAIEYYQKNKEKILERIKNRLNDEMKKDKPKKIVNNGRGRPPINYFVSDNNDVVLKQDVSEIVKPVDDNLLLKRQKKTEYMREYRKKNPERVREYVRKGVKKYYDKHSIELTEKKKLQYKKNREKILERLQKKRQEMKLKEQEKGEQ